MLYLAPQLPHSSECGSCGAKYNQCLYIKSYLANDYLIVQTT